jgi:phenylalanyl-tRNA synthetase alpha chain
LRSAGSKRKSNEQQASNSSPSLSNEGLRARVHHHHHKAWPQKHHQRQGRSAGSKREEKREEKRAPSIKHENKPILIKRLAMTTTEAVEKLLLQTLHALPNQEDNTIDSRSFALQNSLEHSQLTACIRSLTAHELVSSSETSHSRWCLTKEAEQYANHGSPEAQVFRAVVAKGNQGMTMSALKKHLGDNLATVGFKQAMQAKWVRCLKVDKPKEEEVPKTQEEGEKKIKKKKEKPDPTVVALQGHIDVKDVVQQHLLAVQGGNDEALRGDKTLLASLKKRKLVLLEKWNVFEVRKGPKFALEKQQQATDLTHELLADGAYERLSFKKYNFKALGSDTQGGHLHPLLKVRTQFRKIFVRMGFEEMPTNKFVESSFWNFDALFQPQQHPARDAHDTFFVTRPSKTNSREHIDKDYLERVMKVHEDGGYGSVGYKYNWKVSEAEKNILRTHTTAVSSRMLYKLAKQFEKEGKFTPKRYFSIDRVFRNETLDKTHLAEFHQCEGLVVGHNLSLAHLIGTIDQFFKRIGMTQIKFKPAYNPYTEPSMEIFAFHPGLGKWMEIGNSGVFRPEMLRPMGLPEDVQVIAWGFGLERPTMILYGVDNIRDLFGHKVDLDMMKTNPICRIGLD